MRIPIEVPPFVLQAAQAIRDLGGELYLVGGIVRDALLGMSHVSKDFDFEVHGVPQEALYSCLKRFGKPNQVGKAFGITLMRIQGIQYDFALPRTERKVGAGHKGFDVVTDPYLGFPEAATRRDFTLNAMGLRLPDFELVDPWGGQQDLADKKLKHVSPAFSEDPLRALRAVQFAARFGLDIAPETQVLCAEQDLSELSVERFEEEFRKWLSKSPKPSVGLHWFGKLKLERFFPELSPAHWNCSLEQAQKSLDALHDLCADLEQEESLLLAHTLIASWMNPTDMENWLGRFTRDRRLIEGIRLRHQASAELNTFWESERSVGNLRRLSLPYSLDQRLRLHQATCHLDLRPEIQQAAQDAQCWDHAYTPWVQGRDLIELGFKPSPTFGIVLKECFELQMDEHFSDKAAAITWIQERLASDVQV